MHASAPSSEGPELAQWRRTAADYILGVIAVMYFPGALAALLGYDPTLTAPVRVVMLGCCVVFAAAALFRHVHYAVRTHALLATVCFLSIVGMMARPEGPYFRVLPAFSPLLAIGLIGIRGARVWTLIGIPVLVVPPYLHWVPGVALALGAIPDPTPVPAAELAVQGLALTTQMVLASLLLERLYGWLLAALSAQRLATADAYAARRRLQDEIEQRRRLEEEVERISDEERRGLGREIHDGVCQQLTGALLRSQALELRVERGITPPKDEVTALSTLLSETIHEARAVAEGLCPLDATPDALPRALRDLARRAEHLSSVPCVVRIAGDVRIPSMVAAQHLYRIAQEALNNAVHHARAHGIVVELNGEDEGITLTVLDDGIGMPDATRAGGLGLQTMAHRARVLGGTLSVSTRPTGGTAVACAVPRVNGLGRPARRELAELVGSDERR